ncbi:12448_t:CDS:2 [Gigaspora margarita]|uniref:12448_t:CDS:1 n=1 Tax=Gigaspora margarita TaxID=4874 RepID=A0ABN7V7Q3_GIGMA|nr:12448_t:CDS:2 [Gigaspora margarita]
MEIETNPISEDTSRHTRPIVTNNKDRNTKERIELEESYTLWDLPLNFNNTQVKLLMKQYGKVSSINWIFDSFKKRAIVKIVVKNERSKQILDDLWSLPIGRKLTRITKEENEEEVLVNRRKHRLILEGEDMYKAINIKINYGNTFLFWRDISGVERPDRRIVNGFPKSVSKLNQKNILYKKKITCSHNKKNELGENTKYKNYYDEDKKKEGHNVERSRYIESLDEKLQIILQKLDKIEANRLRDGDKRAVKKWLIDKSLIAEDEIEGALDSIWEVLKKKICKIRVARDGKKRPRLDKLIIELGRWVRKVKRKIGRDMTKEDKKNFGLFRDNIRKKFQIEIENIGGKWKDKDIEDLSGWWKILFNKNSDRIEKEKLKQIEWCIERRYQMIDSEQGRMLASLLEKSFNHVIVDKLLKNQNNTRVLTCNSKKVKEITKEFFQKQFRRKCFDSDALGEEWAQVYAPLERVQEK